MNKDVSIEITGIQTDGSQKAKITSSLTGQYYIKNDKHYVLYEEKVDDGNEGSITKNTLIIDMSGAVKVDLIKSGFQRSHLSFKLGDKYASTYKTAYMTFLMVVETTAIDVSITNEEIHADIEYELYLNDEHISHNRILISVK